MWIVFTIAPGVCLKTIQKVKDAPLFPRFHPVAYRRRAFREHCLCFFHPSQAAAHGPCETVAGNFKNNFVMAEDSESAASQQSLELDDQDTCGIDGDNEEENEHMQG